jgi:hypothetical protein
MSRRSRYIQERARNNRDGGIAMARYRYEQREKARKARNSIPSRVKRDLTGIARGAGTFLFGKPRRRRRR